MKKYLLLALCLCIFTSILLTGCGKESSLDEEALAAKAEAYSEALVKGDYGFVTADFDENLAAELNEDKLAEGWQQLTAAVGDYQGHYSTNTEKLTDGSLSVEVISSFDLAAVSVTYTFDASGKLSGIWSSYTDISEDISGNYQEISLSIGEYELPGLLTLPEGAEAPPVILLVAGSGPNDMDETIAGINKPFADLAHGLAQHGIATLRYDKRYCAHPEAASADKLSIQSEVLDDVKTALEMLAADDRIDNQRIYVLGHSLGGMLAPCIASENSQVKGIVIMAGTLRELAEVMVDQTAEAIDQQADGLSPEELDAAIQQLEQLQKDAEAIMALTGDGGNTYQGIPASYWYSLSQAGGNHYLDKLTCPMLILQGDADFQIYPDRDYTLWQEKLAGRDNVTCKLYPGLNHLFMTSSGVRSIADYYNPGHVAQEVIDDIASWIKAN